MDALKLINPEFTIEFADREFKVRKANLEKVILFQTRMLELADQKSKTLEVDMAAYCIYLILSASDQTITEDWVKKNAPGDIDPYEIFEKLGFMSRQKVDLMKTLIAGSRNAPTQQEGQTG